MERSGFLIQELRPEDYDELVSLWRKAGLPFRPRGRDSRRELARQLSLPTSVYLKAVVGWSGTGAPQPAGGRGGGNPAEGESSTLSPRNTTRRPSKRWVMVGAVLGTHDGRKGWVNRLAVLPGYRRRGIGGALVRALEERFREMGLKITCALVEDWNTVSLRAFRAMGYELHRDIFYLSKRRGRGV